MPRRYLWSKKRSKYTKNPTTFEQKHLKRIKWFQDLAWQAKNHERINLFSLLKVLKMWKQKIFWKLILCSESEKYANQKNQKSFENGTSALCSVSEKNKNKKWKKKLVMNLYSLFCVWKVQNPKIRKSFENKTENFSLKAPAKRLQGFLILED